MANAEVNGWRGLTRELTVANVKFVTEQRHPVAEAARWLALATPSRSRGQDDFPEGERDAPPPGHPVVSETRPDLVRPVVTGFVGHDEETAGGQCQLEQPIGQAVAELDLAGGTEAH